MTHAAEEARDLQLLHTTKELQMALSDPMVVSEQKDADVQMAKLIECSSIRQQQMVGEGCPF